MIAQSKPKILLLDDDSSFLDVANYYLEKKFSNTAIITKFTSSIPFFQHIENYCYLPETPKDIIQAFYANEKSQLNIAQTLKDLSELPAILIIDHHLRNETTNGVEISQKIREFFPCHFIILLTSEIDTNKAVNLHNNEIIDLFVRKDDPSPMDYVHSHITKLVNKLKADSYISPQDVFGFENILEDEIYVSKRDELLNEVSYKSYLTISENGNIAVLNMDNQINYYTYSKRVFSING